MREPFAAQVRTFGDPPTVTRARSGDEGTLHLDVSVPERGGLLAVTAFAVATTVAGSFEVP